MIIVGLTGGFGTGKSFAAGIFRSLGAKVIDADEIAHGTLRRNALSYRKIVARFGESILGRRREIDRRKLGKIVFGDKRALKALDSIVHPEVARKIKDKVRQAAKKDVVVIDAPLLVEAGLTDMVDMLVVVTCPRAAQIARCRNKFGLNKEDVLRRIRSQIPLTRKIKMADHVLDNGGSKAVTRREAKKIWRQIVWR